MSRRQLQGLRPSRGARDNPNYCAEISPAQDQEQEQEQDAGSGQGFLAHECSFTTSEGTITITTTTTTASAATAATATTRRRLVMLRFVPLLLGWANCSSSSGGTWHHRALGTRHVADACQVDLHIPFGAFQGMPRRLRLQVKCGGATTPKWKFRLNQRQLAINSKHNFMAVTDCT